MCIRDRKTIDEPKSSEDALPSNAVRTVTATVTVSTNQDETYDDEDEDDNQVGKRFESKTSTLKHLANLVYKKKETSDFVLSRKYGQRLQIILKRQHFIDHQQHNAEKSFILLRELLNGVQKDWK